MNEKNMYGVFDTETKLELVVGPDGSHRWVDNLERNVTLKNGERIEIRRGNKPTRFATRAEAEDLTERIGASCVVSVCPRIYYTANIVEPAEKIVVRN